jgi:hypothetical protein
MMLPPTKHIAMLLSAALLVACGGEDSPSDDRPGSVLPKISGARLIVDAEVNPGLAAHAVGFSGGYGLYDVEMFYRFSKLDPWLPGESANWVPVPESTILEHVPESGELEGNAIRGLVYDITKPVIVLSDIRAFADSCTTIAFGMRVVGSDQGIQGISWPGLWTWPHSTRPEMTIEITGEGSFDVEREGEQYFVDVPLRGQEADPRITVMADGVPTERAPDPHVYCRASRDGASQAWDKLEDHPPNLQPHEPWPYLYQTLTIDRPGEAEIICSASVHSFRNCVRYWDVPRPDLTTTATITIRAYDVED